MQLANKHRTRPAVSPFDWTFDSILMVILGALQTLTYVYTEAWWVQITCFGLLAWRAVISTPKHAALLGISFGTAWFASGIWWLFISMHHYGGLPAWLAVLAIFALCVFLASYLAIALFFFARWRSGQPFVDALLFAALWLLAELARGVLFTGFPWLASGYAHIDGPLASFAPWVGVYGIGFIAAFIGACIAMTWVRLAQRRVSLSIAIAVIGAGYLIPFANFNHFTQASNTLHVALLQGNIPQEEKFATLHQGEALEWHVNKLLAATTDLVIAPETAIPFLPQQMPPEFWSNLQTHFETGNPPGKTYALFGIPLGDDQKGYTNSAFGIAPGHPHYRYNKHHLVPFGEFIPQGFKWFTQLMNIPLGDFNRGTLNAPSFVVKGERIAPNICYEDLFGEELAARFESEANAPTVFANLSNIGWFGDTVAIDQHLNISRMRTLEFERPMLRATNTGATVIIDHLGHVSASLKPHTRGVLEGTVQGRQGLTPFAWWASRWSLWPLVSLSLIGLLTVAWIKKKQCAKKAAP